MNYCCLKVADSSGNVFFVDDLENVNQLYGAMRQAVELGCRLVSVSISDETL